MSHVWSEEAGPADAPLLVLVHGTMDRSTGMLRLSRRLDDRFRVIRYDRRGYGRSLDTAVGLEGPFDMPAQVDDLIDLLDDRPALLIGHSYGGNVAMAAAERFPDLVAGVGLYETPLSWQPWWPGTTAGAAARVTDGTPADAAERFMRRLVSDRVWDTLPPERTRQIRRSEGAAMVGELRDLQANPPWHPEAIHCPLVVSYGTEGAEHHAHGMRFVQGQFPKCELRVIEGARHDAPNSHSRLFAEVVVEPLACLAGPPWSDRVQCPGQPV